MMPKMRLIRGSEVQSFLTDRMSWKWSWVDKLKKNTPDKKLFFGELFHKHMEHLYDNRGEIAATYDQTNTWLREKDVSEMDAVDYQETMQLFHDVAGFYESVYADEHQNIRVLATELRFAIPIFEGDDRLNYAYEGTIDLLYIEDRKLKFSDHKTVSSIERYVNNSVLDRQISRYWWALTALCEGFGYIWDAATEEWLHVQETVLWDDLQYFKGPDEFIYNIIKKEAPKPPKQLKSGISVDKKQKTTYELYAKALEEAGIYKVGASGSAEWATDTDRLKYSEMLDFLYERGNVDYVRRISVIRSDVEAQAAMEDFNKVAKAILRLRDLLQRAPEKAEEHLYYNITWDTPTYNQYYPLIQAMVKDENVDMIKASLYKVDEDFNPESEYITVEVDE